MENGRAGMPGILEFGRAGQAKYRHAHYYSCVYKTFQQPQDMFQTRNEDCTCFYLFSKPGLHLKLLTKHAVLILHDKEF